MMFSCFQKLFSRTVFINRNRTCLNTLTSTPKGKQVMALGGFFLFAMVDNDKNYLGLLQRKVCNYVLEFRLKNKENTENTKFREQKPFSNKTQMVFSCFKKLLSRTVFINRNRTSLNTYFDPKGEASYGTGWFLSLCNG